MPEGFQKGNQYGKLKGKNRKTLEKERQKQLYETYLLKKILEEKGEIIFGLLKEAKGGNIQAIKEIHERLLGKVIDEIKHSGEIVIPITKINIVNPTINEKKK